MKSSQHQQKRMQMQKLNANKFSKPGVGYNIPPISNDGSSEKQIVSSAKNGPS